MRDEPDGALTQLKAWLAQRELAPGGRLPAERELCELLGVSRGELRKALAALEADGLLWRHVGKGTFVGLRPAEELSSVRAVAARSNPREVMQARLIIEPILAREAALNATGEHLAELRRSIRASREAATWRQYETYDNHFHRTVAEAAGNTVLTALFDQLNAVRRAVVWGRLRDQTERPPRDHHSFAEHDRILAALSDRDQGAAQRAMLEHLLSVQANLLRPRQAAE
jgi:DNA-binding FadR family transcriptional regulator